MKTRDKVVPKRGKIFYGWWMVLAGTVLNFVNGGTFHYGFTVFFNPIRKTFGWTAAVTSIAFVLQRLESGILGPVTGFLVDRVGPRKLMIFGWGCIGLGFVLMGRINSLWAFYGSFLIIAIGFSFGSSIVQNTAIAHWFVKKRSRAIMVMYTGFGACGILVPLMALAIAELGWRETLVITGIGLWCLGLPLSSLMRYRPAQYGYLPDGESSITEKGKKPELPITAAGLTVREAMKTRAFWLISFAGFFQHIGTSAVIVHIVPYLESVDVPTTIAASVVTGMTLCSLIGRIGFGFMGDFVNKRYLLTISFALQTLGIFIFSLIDVSRVWLIIPFLLIYGTGYGGPTAVSPALRADYFGMKNFGTIMGLMSIVSMGSGLASPVLAGWIFDVMGSYRPAWQLFALMAIPAIPLMLLAKPPKVEQGHNFT